MIHCKPCQTLTLRFDAVDALEILWQTAANCVSLAFVVSTAAHCIATVREMFKQTLWLINKPCAVGLTRMSAGRGE